MKKNIITIVLTGGGSGGHITPLLPLAHALKDKSPQCHIVYIGLKGEKIEGLETRYTVFDEISFVSSGKFRRYHGESLLAHLVDVKTLALNARDLVRVVIGTFSARRQLRRYKPAVLFSKGSFVAVPVGLAARSLGIPIITHDSDAIPGLANRIIGKSAVIHAVGQDPENYNYPRDSVRYTGIPVDERIKLVTKSLQRAAKNELGIDPDDPVLLVAGGGLGSGRLNDLVISIAPELLVEVKNLRIINITGSQHQAPVRAKYEQIPQAQGRVQILGFTPDFYKYSTAADLIFTRAGATMLAEFAVQNKATVVMPATQLAGGHQLANVKRLRALDTSMVVEDDIEPQKLLKLLVELLENQGRREELGTKLGSLARPDAANELAEIILEVASGGEQE